MTRTTRAALAAIPAALVLAATAQGNVGLDATCRTVTLSGFSPAALPLQVTITSDAGLHRSGPYAGPGWTIPVPAEARGTVRAVVSDGYTTWTSDVCVIAVPPPPPPGPPVAPPADGPGVGEPAPRVEPMPRKEATPRRPVRRVAKPKPGKRVTPARLCPPEKAGRRWHVKARAERGCAMPSRFRPVRRSVGVAG